MGQFGPVHLYFSLFLAHFDHFFSIFDRNGRIFIRFWSKTSIIATF
jgi:hypothetical protein